MNLTSGSFFAGYGGLTMAVEDALGTTPLWVSEYEPPSKRTAQPTQAAARILAHRFPLLPNLGDIQAIDPSRIDGVDVVDGGYPCPGESAAGLRLGTADPRWMWPAYFAFIRETRPRLAVGENVRGHLSRSFRYVLADLQSIGYAVTWSLIAASDIGACHERMRLIWTAYDESAGAPSGIDSQPVARLDDGDWVTPDLFGRSRLTRLPYAGAAYAGAAYAGAAYAGAAPSSLDLLKTPTAQLAINGGSQHPDKRRAGGHGPTLADEVEHLLPTPTTQDAANIGGPSQLSRNSLPLNALAALLPNALPPADLPTARVDLFPYARPAGGDRARFGDFAPAIARQELFSGPAPNPTAPAPRGGMALNPHFVEWMMDAPAGHVCDVPGLTRNEKLRALGNGVVRRQGAAAVAFLADRIPASVLASRHVA